MENAGLEFDIGGLIVELIFEFLALLFGTVLLRPYVFAFLTIFLFLASQQIGWRRTLIWTVTGYTVAFLCEYSSIHCGFPFGDYYYIDTTRDRELWVAGVPFMDSLSFSFLSFTGYSCSWQLSASRKAEKGPVGRSEYLRIRNSPQVMLLGAAITTLMDIIIDPVTLMGDQWFLGLIYGYRQTGLFFGVPMTNFAGWLFVSGAIIAVNQILDALSARATPAPSQPFVPYLHLGGFVLFFFVGAFNVAIALWLKAAGPSLSGIFIIIGFFWTAGSLLKRGGLFVPSLFHESHIKEKNKQYYI